jgi:hypothetical protein
VIKKGVGGLYDIVQSVHSYIKFIRSKGGNASTGKCQNDYSAEKLRKLKEEADKLERERLRDEGRTLEAEECYKMMTNTYTSIRQKIMSEVQLTAETKSEILLTLKEAALGR